MARGFGSTFGAGTTDAVASSYSINTAGKRSYALWFYVNGPGGNNLGRFWNTTVENVFWDSAASVFRFVRVFSTTNGNWTMALPSLGVWHHICLTYDASSTSTTPTVYIDGVSVTVTTSTAPAGTATTTSGVFSIGNNAATGGIRVWDGMHAQFAIWDGVLLSAGDARSLANGINPILIRPDSMVSYLPLDGINNPEPDLILGTSNTITGTWLGKREPPVQPLTSVRSLYAYQNDKLAAAGQILPFPWMQTSGGMRDMTGGMRN